MSPFPVASEFRLKHLACSDSPMRPIDSAHPIAISVPSTEDSTSNNEGEDVTIEFQPLTNCGQCVAWTDGIWFVVIVFAGSPLLPALSPLLQVPLRACHKDLQRCRQQVNKQRGDLHSYHCLIAEHKGLREQAEARLRVVERVLARWKANCHCDWRRGLWPPSTMRARADV